MRRRNIYILCGSFKELSEVDAKDRFETIRKYWNCVNEVCRHFILYCGLQVNGDEKTWNNISNSRLILCVLWSLTSGIAFDDGVNEKPTSSTFDTTEIFKEVEEKRHKQRRGDKNDAVLYQDDSAHYFGDIIKLARNGIDDVIHYFVQYPTSSITTAKKIKSIGIHGIYEIFYTSSTINKFFNPNKHRTQKATRGLCTKDKIYYNHYWLKALLEEGQSVEDLNFYI